MPNPVVHFEIDGKDIHKTRTFYSRLFGWDIKLDASGYGLVDTGTDDGIQGGIVQAPQGTPAHATIYVGVDDLEKYLELAESLGATRLIGPMPVGEMGEFAMFADPDGVVIGLFRETAIGRER